MQEEDLPHPWGMEAGGEFLHRGEWQPHNQACEWHQAAGRTFPLPLLRQGRAEPREEYCCLLQALSTEKFIFIPTQVKGAKKLVMLFLFSL